MGTYSDFVAFENMGYRLGGTEPSDYETARIICDCDVIDADTGEVVVELGDAITPDLAERIVALGTAMACDCRHYELCPDGAECPGCGQRAIDLLEWDELECVHCAVCGSVYDPLA